MAENFRFVDLFAGIGGMRLGFEAAGGTCVLTSEWNKPAQVTYRANEHNFRPSPEHVFVEDVRDIINSEIVPRFEVLVAGFPCQPFSIAGVSKKNALGRPHGFACEAQGTLFFDLAKLIKAHQPKAFLLENVKNLRSHDGGNTFKVILKILKDDLKYEVGYRVLDARAFLPQHRERIFIIGIHPDLAKADLIQDSLDALRLPPHSGGPRLKSILHGFVQGEAEEPRFSVSHKGKIKAAPRYTLTPRLWQYLKAYSEKHRAKGNGFGFGLVGPDDVARTLSARYYKDGSEILVRQPPQRPRRLTPRECSRLMGFSSAEREFVIPETVSDTQAYRQFGNAVAVPVVALLASLIKTHLDGTVKVDRPKPKQILLPSVSADPAPAGV